MAYSNRIKVNATGTLDTMTLGTAVPSFMPFTDKTTICTILADDGTWQICNCTIIGVELIVNEVEDNSDGTTDKLDFTGKVLQIAETLTSGWANLLKPMTSSISMLNPISDGESRFNKSNGLTYTFIGREMLPSALTSFDVVIDSSLVSEDLYDFPVLLNFGDVSGIDGYNTEDIFSVVNNKNIQVLYKSHEDSTPDSVNDSFTGNDGDTADPILWSALDDNPPSFIQNNKLEITISNNTGVLSHFSKWSLVGDFDIQVDMDIPVYQSIDGWMVALQCKSLTNTGNRFYISKSYGAGIGHVWLAQRSLDNVHNQYISSVDASSFSGKLRLVRTGNMLETLFDTGSGWVSLANDTWVLDEVEVMLYGYQLATPANLTFTYDNFILNSGTVNWPTPSDTTAITQQCKVEIDRWDQANKEAQLWAKIPYISKDADTIINVSYDPNNPDNSDNVGYTGEQPAQEVWQSYTAVYHLSSDGTDSTVNSYNGSLVNMDDSNISISGAYGTPSLSFNGNDEYILLPDIQHGEANMFNISFTSSSNSYASNNYVMTLNGSLPMVLVLSNTANEIRTLVAHDIEYQDATLTGFDTFGFHTYSINHSKASLLDVYADGTLLSTGNVGSGEYAAATPYVSTIGAARSEDSVFFGLIKEVRVSTNLRTNGYLEVDTYSIRDTLLRYRAVDPPAIYTGLAGQWVQVVDTNVGIQNTPSEIDWPIMPAINDVFTDMNGTVWKCIMAAPIVWCRQDEESITTLKTYFLAWS